MEGKVPNASREYPHNRIGQYHRQNQADNTRANGIVDALPNHHLGQLLCSHADALHGRKFMAASQNCGDNGVGQVKHTGHAKDNSPPTN